MRRFLVVLDWTKKKSFLKVVCARTSKLLDAEIKCRTDAKESACKFGPYSHTPTGIISNSGSEKAQINGRFLVRNCNIKSIDSNHGLQLEELLAAEIFYK